MNEYMEKFRERCVQLQPDRTDIIKRESANFVVTLKESAGRSEIVYGSGVEYIAKRMYLPPKKGIASPSCFGEQDDT